MRQLTATVQPTAAFAVIAETPEKNALASFFSYRW